MNDAAPDFYMGSGDSIILANPRRCWRVKRVKTSFRPDDLLVIRVDPLIPGKPYGLACDLEYVIVETHLKGDSLFPMSRLPAEPLPVCVARPLVDWRDRTHVNQLEALAWAELYPSEAEARAKMTYAQARKYGKRI